MVELHRREHSRKTLRMKKRKVANHIDPKAKEKTSGRMTKPKSHWNATRVADIIRNFCARNLRAKDRRKTFPNENGKAGTPDHRQSNGATGIRIRQTNGTRTSKAKQPSLIEISKKMFPPLVAVGYAREKL